MVFLLRENGLLILEAFVLLWCLMLLPVVDQAFLLRILVFHQVVL